MVPGEKPFPSRSDRATSRLRPCKWRKSSGQLRIMGLRFNRMLCAVCEDGRANGLRSGVRHKRSL